MVSRETAIDRMFKRRDYGWAGGSVMGVRRAAHDIRHQRQIDKATGDTVAAYLLPGYFKIDRGKH
ncbi:hypothetical protein IB238_09025 [Rhizobium sp. ARZ01]|uniref:hypothetical protein n=1 Tax=Rhizobium sp. ARZ01 TaxID=2769313 RepID=UPI0017803997|nr:hypothetical protein [Rhizobium sp. ARZ01]MBD9372762.1 hypothetical protein [Rhizobium sp. ARZ01]